MLILMLILLEINNSILLLDYYIGFDCDLVLVCMNFNIFLKLIMVIELFYI